MPYRAPLREFAFLFDHVVDLAQVSGTARFAEASRDVTDAILAEAINWDFIATNLDGQGVSRADQPG